MTERPSRKLDQKMIGPYKIKKPVKLLYQLNLPTSMKIHDMFHFSLLWKISIDPLPSQHNNSALPIIV